MDDILAVYFMIPILGQTCCRKESNVDLQIECCRREEKADEKFSAATSFDGDFGLIYLVGLLSPTILLISNLPNRYLCSALCSSVCFLQLCIPITTSTRPARPLHASTTSGERTPAQ